MSLDLSNKWAVITGGTDGIGKEIAFGLARAGCQLKIVGRDAVKGARVEDDIRQTTGNPEVQFLQADLSLVRETERLANHLNGCLPRLDFLVHSAGIVRGRYELTDEGVESNFAVNYLNRFVLTTRLLSLLKLSGCSGEAARIVIVGGAAQGGRIHFNDVNLTANFNTIRTVLQFAAANDVFTVELARRLSDARTHNVTIACLKIGVVKTNIRREFPRWMKWLVPLLFDPLLGQTPQEAADSALRLLLGKEFEGESGALYLQIRKFKRVKPTRREVDPREGQRLWELSERLGSGKPDRQIP